MFLIISCLIFQWKKKLSKQFGQKTIYYKKNQNIHKATFATKSKYSLDANDLQQNNSVGINFSCMGNWFSIPVLKKAANTLDTLDTF